MMNETSMQDHSDETKQEKDKQDACKDSMQCKYCMSDIPNAAKICSVCKRNQKWYLNFRISDVLLFVSLCISFGMVLFTFLNFQEAREERVKAAVALTTASDAAEKASKAVTQADEAALRVSKAEESVHGTVERMKKLEKYSVDVNNTVKQMQTKTTSSFKTFNSTLEEMKSESATLGLYYNARGGDRTAFNNLTKLVQKGEGRRRTLIKSLLDDTNLYYRDYKQSFQQQQIINTKTREPIRLAAEDLYNILYKDKNSTMREAAANQIADRKLDYLVHDLLNVVRNDPNLKVACRAAKAIETISGKHLGEYPPYQEVEHWWEKTGSSQKRYSNRIQHLKNIPNTFQVDQALAIIKRLEEIVGERVGMCVTQAHIAKIYLAINDIGKAKQHLKSATEQCDQQDKAMFLFATLLYNEGKKDEVMKILSKMKPLVSDETLFEKECRSTFPNLEKEKRFNDIFKAH